MSYYRNLFIALAVVFCGLPLNSSTLAETWAERLGFPADKRVVVLHAHDLGLCFETNVAAEKLLNDGMVQSASAMAPCPWFADSAAWARDNPKLDIGLQLTLNSELAPYRWKPVVQHGLAASLVDSQGYFWPSVLQTTVNSQVIDIEHELEAQLARARLLGLNPSHLTSHLGALYSRTEFTEAYLRFARRNWIPAVVVELTPELIESFRQQGYPLPDELLQIARAYPLPKLDDLKILPVTDSAEEKRRQFLELFDSLAPGLTQVSCTPAVPSEALKRIDSQWQQRVWELELLSDAGLRDQLESQGVVFTNWREIMQRFGGPSR